MLCIAGAFFAGFGGMHSMLFNQIGGMLAVGDRLFPLRQASRVRAAKDRKSSSRHEQRCGHRVRSRRKPDYTHPA